MSLLVGWDTDIPPQCKEAAMDDGRAGAGMAPRTADTSASPRRVSPGTPMSQRRFGVRRQLEEIRGKQHARLGRPRRGVVGAAVHVVAGRLGIGDAVRLARGLDPEVSVDERRRGYLRPLAEARTLD